MSRITPQHALKATTVLATVVMAVAVSAPPATAAPKVENGNVMFTGYDAVQSQGFVVWQVVPRSTDGTRVSTWDDSPGGPRGMSEAHYSADGTKVAYQHFADITVRDTASGAVIKKLNDLGGWANQGLDWSPDGKKLVVSDGLSVKILDLATKTLTTIFETGRPSDSIGDGISWSPDGKWITFSTDGIVENSIRSIHPDGTGLKRVLYRAPAEGYYFDRPQWSPDSTRLAYLSSQRDMATGVTLTTELVTVDKKGENPVHVSDLAGGPAAGHSLIDVAWSPDGKRIAALDFAQPAPGVGIGQVRAYVADGSNRSWLTPAQTLDQYGNGNAHSTNTTIDWGRKLP